MYVFLLLQVSWIRRKDYHLLTVGLTSYTVDERYQPVHYQNSEVTIINYSFFFFQIVEYLNKQKQFIYT